MKKNKFIKTLTLAVCANIFCSAPLFAAINLSDQVKDLTEVYQQALHNSPQLDAQKATMQAQQELVGINLGKALPNITLTGNVGSTYLSAGSASTPGGNISGSFRNATFAATLTQALLNYGVFAGYKYSKQLASQAQETYRSQQQGFILQVASAYFAVLLAKDNVSFSKANLEAAKTTLERTEVMFKTGMSTDVNVKQAQANYYTAEATLVRDNNTLRNKRYDLYVLTGVLNKHLAPLKKDILFTNPIPNNVSKWIEVGNKNNANLIAQRYGAQASDSLVDTANSLFLPSLSLIATYTVGSYGGNLSAAQASGITLNGESTLQNGYIGLALTWNIFNGGTDYATRLQAANNFEAQTYQTLDISRSLDQSLRNDYNNVVALVVQVKALEQALTAAKLAYEQFMEQYKVGTTTIADVLDQQKIMFQAMTNLAQAKYQYINAMLRLKFDAGTISERDINHFNSWLVG